jgi:hypothetical protein
MKFFSAYAVRHFVTTNDILEMHDTFEQAYDQALSYLCDDDDAGVFCLIEKDDCSEREYQGFFRVHEKINDKKYRLSSMLYSYILQNFILEIN